ncbi:MAG: lactonase family protein [Terracidiphilus sp.]
MKTLSRRSFLVSASAATLAATAAPHLAAGAPAKVRSRVFVGSGGKDGILAFDWDAATGELTPAGVAAKLSTVDWITYSPKREFIYAAAELDSFNGKATGAVASFGVHHGELTPLSAQNSASKGTCHVALDHTGRVLLAADYGGGTASSYLVTDGKLSPVVWSEHYTVFAYFNDLGGDCIHIYKLNAATAELTGAGKYQSAPGAGPRTLHFHPNGHTAYSMNELDSTVDVLEWHRADGSLTRVTTIHLLPADWKGDTHGCDTVISKDGKTVYFANRGNNAIYLYHADFKTGALTLGGQTDCGGKIPRNFVLDPTERWMVVANQVSNNLSVFARNPETGELAKEGKSVAAVTPMCILFE